MLRSLVLLALLALPLEAQGLQLLLPGQLPRKCTIETSYITDIRWTSAAWARATGLMGNHYPNEAGMCLYGGFERLPGGYTLVITGALEGRMTMATADSVRFQCPRDPSWLGTLHTHTDSTRLCVPSPRNFQILLWEDQVVIEYILCVDGSGYYQLKDGRWSWLTWREP
jgi:hypothetical protein